MNITELKELLPLTTEIFTNNFTKESNYIYFHESGKLWASNSTNSIEEDECLLIHDLSTPIFSNVGILAKEFTATIRNLSDEVEITEGDNYVLLTDEKVSVKIRTVPYTSCPVKVSTDVEFSPIECKVNDLIPPLIEFMDKNDSIAKRLHFNCNEISSTDRVSVHVANLNEKKVCEGPFGVNPRVGSIMDSFDYIHVGELLYLKKECGTILITRYTDPTDFSYMKEFGKEGITIPTPTIGKEELLKTFMADIKKPDREFIVRVGDGKMFISAVDGRKGGVEVAVDIEVDVDINIEFKVNVDKFTSICKNFSEFTIDGDVLVCNNGVHKKYLRIEEV